MNDEHLWIAGGYADAGAVGLYLLRSAHDRLRVERVVAPAQNVSAGVRRGNYWYLVDEVAGTVVVLDAATGWRQVACFASGGDAPCHLALDAAATLLAVANYGDGTIALFAIDDHGLPSGVPDRYRHDGHGPVADRQAGPHAHWVGFGPAGDLYVTDLGSDCILTFAPEAGQLGTPRIAYRAPAGSGPRQIAFHPKLPVLYLVSELASTLTVLDRQVDGMLVARQTVSTVPAGADNLAGAILRDGDRLYVTNRGHDSVARFEITADGSVRAIDDRPSGGVSPRFVALDGDRLLVAHEKTGGVTLVPIDDDRILARADVPGAAFLGAYA
ncbi:lactonase family protein [Sphingomonas sp. SAFR-052]|uniref:lactonase family protein n=1 Tax=Sphingomonas sp. SAFR-052 TaxID=3436867 RepID=UPI003F803063